MQLAVFDLDDTLVSTRAIEDRCYERALCDAFGLKSIDCDWSRYNHVSDIGVATQVYEEAFGKPPSSAELERAAARFLELLKIDWQRDKSEIVAVPGAFELLQTLPQHGWAVAIATGGWKRSALFKLQAARLTFSHMPFASAEDGPARIDIVGTAIRRASVQHLQQQFDRVVSIGDGVWDVKAAIELQLPFLGVGRGARANRLNSLGAQTVVEDFSNATDILALLAETAIPRSVEVV